MDSPILTIGFDGANRSGKDTHIHILKEKIQASEIPCLVVRGDGSRSGNGDNSEMYNPSSNWWKQYQTILHSSPEDITLWEKASTRIAREVIYFKKRFDQQLTTRKVKKEGVLILNRTLLSRLSLLTECPIPLQPPLSVADLYERKMDYQALTPDIIFNLVASKKELISRLDPRDVKYNFRKHVIEKKSNLYLDMVGKFTEEIRSRIITISTENVPKEEIAQIIFKTVQDKLLLLSHS